MRFFALLLITFICLRCSDDSSHEHPLEFTFDKHLTDSIGCGCAFSNSQGNYQKRKYVMATSMDDSTLIISLNGQLNELQLESSTREPNSLSNVKRYTEVYSSRDLIASLVVAYVRDTGEEAWWNKAVLTVYKQGHKKRIALEGECGC